MPRYIIQHDGWYFEWSTVVDAPVSRAMRLDEFWDYYKDQYGRVGLDQLPQRLERANNKGTSSFLSCSFDDLIENNRAGLNEETLSKEEILKFVGIAK